MEKEKLFLIQWQENSEQVYATHHNGFYWDTHGNHGKNPFSSQPVTGYSDAVEFAQWILCDYNMDVFTKEELIAKGLPTTDDLCWTCCHIKYTTEELYVKYKHFIQSLKSKPNKR